MNKMGGGENKLSLLSSKLMNKMRWNKLVLLSSKLMNKMGRTACPILPGSNGHFL